MKAKQIARLAAFLPVVVLTACGGGGGGGAGVPPAVPAGVGPASAGSVAVTAVTASTSPPRQPAGEPGTVSPFLGILFPLYPFIAGGAPAGSRFESSDGTLDVSFPLDLLSGDGRRVIFTPRATFDRTAEDMSVFWGEYAYVEGFADADVGYVLRHARIGAIVAPVGTASVGVPFYYGFETPPAALPSIGRAHYLGQAAGFSAGTTSPGALLGEVALTADLVQGGIRGRLYDVVIEGESGGSVPLGIEFVLSGSLDRTGDPGTVTLGGTVAGQVAADGTAAGGSGSFIGRFFGPAGEEIAATWSFTQGTDLDLWGVLGAQSLAGAQGAGHPGAARVFAAAGGGSALDGAADRFYPGYHGLSGNSPDIAVRRDRRGVVWLSHRLTSDNALQVFRPGDVTVDLAHRLAAARWTDRFEELSATTLPGLLEGGGRTLEYSRYGWYSAGAIQAQPFHRGLLTPASAVAADARVAYLGVADLLPLDGRAPSTLSDTTIQAQVSVAIDRVAGTTTGKVSAFTSLDAQGRVTAHDRIPWFVVQSPAPTDSDGAMVVSAGLMFTTDPFRRLVGALYGPAGDELAGTFRMGDEKGAYGAVRADLLSAVAAPWVARGGALAWTMTALARQMVFDGTGLVSDIVSQPGVETTLASRADGGVVLRIADPGGTRTLEYARTSLQHDYYGGLRPEAPQGLTDRRIGFLTGATDGVELSTGRVVELDHTRFGYWAETAGSGGAQVFTPFSGGAETPIAQVPTAGAATYSGAIVGSSVFFGELVRFSGDLSLRADFGARTVTTASAPSLQGFALNGPNAGSSIPPGFLALDFSGTIAGNAIRGTVDGGPTAGVHTWNGSFEGRFYGPYAAEAAAVWTVERSDGNIRAWGSFGLAR